MKHFVKVVKEIGVLIKVDVRGNFFFVSLSVNCSKNYGFVSKIDVLKDSSTCFKVWESSLIVTHSSFKRPGTMVLGQFPVNWGGVSFDPFFSSPL